MRYEPSLSVEARHVDSKKYLAKSLLNDWLKILKN